MQSRRWFRLLVLAAGLVFWAACAHRGVDRDPAHVAEEPVAALSKFNWIEVGAEDFARSAQRPPFGVGRPLAPEHPLVARLQAWSDSIHEEVRRDFQRQFPKETFLIPRPLIQVVPSREANAWVSGLPICIDLPVIVSTPSAVPGVRAKRLLLEAAAYQERTAARGPLGPPPCLKAAASSDLAGFVDWFNAFSPDCRLELAQGTLRLSGERCLEKTSRGFSEAEGLEYYAISNRIHFTSKFLEITEEEDGVIGTIAHELGHYYRTHTIMMLLGRRYEFWYRQSDPPRPGVPEPLADSTAINAEIDRYMPRPVPVVAGRQLGLAMSGFIVSSLASWLRQRAEAAGPGFSCASAVELLKGAWTSDFNCLSCPSASVEAEQKYLRYEKELLQCASKVKVAPGEITGVVRSSGLARHVSRMPEASDLRGVLRELNDQALEIDRWLARFLRRMADENLGYYTSEQEADDFAVEYVAKIGRDPSRVNERKFMQYRYLWDKEPRDFLAKNGGVSFDDCLQRRAEGWRRPLPFGTFHDIHHGACFRFFNMDQEVRAHGWKASGKPPPVFRETWSSLRALAAKVSSGFAPPPMAPFRDGPGESSSSIPQGGLIIDGLSH